MVVVGRSFYLFYFNNTKPRAHCARDSAHVVLLIHTQLIRLEMELSLSL